MPRWRGKSFGPTQFQNGLFDGDWVPVSGFTAPTLLRTIASVHVSYSNEDVPPALTASGNPNLHLRILTIPDGDALPSGWPQDPNADADDVCVAPIIWNTAIAVPAGFTTGSSSNIHYHGSLSGGIVDVKSERAFAFEVHPHTYVSVGPLDSTGSGPGIDSFTCQILVRQLFKGI